MTWCEDNNSVSVLKHCDVWSKCPTGTIKSVSSYMTCLWDWSVSQQRTKCPIRDQLLQAFNLKSPEQVMGCGRCRQIVSHHQTADRLLRQRQTVSVKQKHRRHVLTLRTNNSTAQLISDIQSYSCWCAQSDPGPSGAQWTVSIGVWLCVCEQVNDRRI